jgi:LuxR family maltose regulon positive regulatory protein
MTSFSDDLIPRPRLTASLRASLERTSLTALVAPAGYGKTSALSLALAEDDRSAWYTAQLWHAGEFVEPLVREVRHLRPDFGRLTLALASRTTGAANAQGAARAQRMGATFAQELEHISEPLRIVFDDVHLLEGDEVFGGFVTGLMRTLPAHVSLVLCGRTLPSLPLAEWIAQGRAQLVGVEHLRLDDTEVAELAMRHGRDLGAQQAAELREAFEGWAAGIVLSVAGGDLPVPSRDGSRSATTALLIDTNLALLDAEMVRFLERTSVFETLHAPLLERDATLGSVRHYLREFERRGVMLSVVKPAEIYRVHPLLREALLERVRARDGSTAIDGAHRWAGELLESTGADLPALFHFEHSRDDRRLARFVQDHVYALFIAGLGERAGRIARGLRQRGLEEPVLFGLVEGMLLRQRGEPGAAERLDDALAAARLANETSIEVTIRSVLTEERLARRERVPDGELDDLLHLARAGGAGSELVAYTFAGWSHVLAEDFVAARQSAHAAFARAGDDLVSRVRVAILDAYAATSLGRFEEADALMAQTLQALEPSDHVVLMANTLVWYARLALLWGDSAAAKDYAEKGRELGRRLELPAELAAVELALAEIYAHDGALRECEEAAAAARSDAAAAWYAADRDRAPALASLFLARAKLAAGEADAALATVTAALAESDLPSAQRLALLSEATAYAHVAGDEARNRLALQAEAELPNARASDALDALSIATAAELLRKLRVASGNKDVDSLVVPAAVAHVYGAFLARRRDLAPGQKLTAAPSRIPSASGEPRASQLTKRETQIVELLAEGLTNKEIAQHFSLSPRTVDTHVERVLSKLNATTRTRAVAAAIRAGIVAAP